MNNLRWFGLALGLCLGFALSYIRPADAARNGSGTYSLPNTASVPNPVVAGTTITAAWANGTLTDVASELTNSLDRGGRGAMTAPLQLASGTAAAPSLTFSSMTNTGLYKTADGGLGLSTSGTVRQYWTSTASVVSVDMSVTGASSHGLVSTGAAAGGDGVQGYGTVGRYGGYFVGGPDDAVALYAEARDAGIGIQAVGGPTGGYGLYVTGGLGTAAISATGGSGNANGVLANGTGSGIGLVATPGTASTGNVRTEAIRVTNGDIFFSGGTPWVDGGAANHLSSANVPKAWGRIENLASTGPARIAGGYNFATADCDGGDLYVTFTSPMADDNYTVTLQGSQSGVWYGLAPNAQFTNGFQVIQETGQFCTAGSWPSLGFVVYGVQ